MGLDLAAVSSKLKITEERLAAWEEGGESPTIAQMRKLAALYKRPLAVFYLPEPPVDFQPLRDFRRLPAAELGIQSPALHSAIRRAHFQREAALDLRALVGEPVSEAPRLMGAARDPEAVGHEARQLLNVDLQTQFSWDDPGRALRGWTEAIEELDVLVLQAQRIPTTEMRGFSVTEPEMPVIVLNGADYARAKIFTLLHEFAHILLNAAGVCDLHDRRVRNPTDDIEVFCNRVAAAVLLPAKELAKEPLLQEAPSGGKWSGETISYLAERYAVSQEAVTRRLYALNLASWDFLQFKIREFRAAYEEQKRLEDEKRRAAKKPGGPSYYRMLIRDYGRAYTRLALEAYHRDDINASELSDYLDIKLNKLPRLEDELLSTEARR
jgi:Zn-dependent peptidase ImmA (M78 family)/transcriptional regulator with XRE-family HTH domain